MGDRDLVTPTTACTLKVLGIDPQTLGKPEQDRDPARPKMDVYLTHDAAGPVAAALMTWGNNPNNASVSVVARQTDGRRDRLLSLKAWTAFGTSLPLGGKTHMGADKDHVTCNAIGRDLECLASSPTAEAAEIIHDGAMIDARISGQAMRPEDVSPRLRALHDATAACRIGG